MRGTREPELPVRGQGLVLREWDTADTAVMVELFDTEEMDRWTPLPHPFNAEVAVDYVHGARQARTNGTLQLAITHEGGSPLGEVLLFPTGDATICEFAFAVGRAHHGQQLAARAVRALFPTARARGCEGARLAIATTNIASQKTAAAAGFVLTSDPLQRRERKGHVLHMATWTRSLVDEP